MIRQFWIWFQIKVWKWIWIGYGNEGNTSRRVGQGVGRGGGCGGGKNIFQFFSQYINANPGNWVYRYGDKEFQTRVQILIQT